MSTYTHKKSQVHVNRFTLYCKLIQTPMFFVFNVYVCAYSHNYWLLITCSLNKYNCCGNWAFVVCSHFFNSAMRVSRNLEWTFWMQIKPLTFLRCLVKLGLLYYMHHAAMWERHMFALFHKNSLLQSRLVKSICDLKREIKFTITNLIKF